MKACFIIDASYKDDIKAVIQLKTVQKLQFVANEIQTNVDLMKSNNVASASIRKHPEWIAAIRAKLVEAEQLISENKQAVDELEKAYESATKTASEVVHVDETQEFSGKGIRKQ